MDTIAEHILQFYGVKEVFHKFLYAECNGVFASSKCRQGLACHTLVIFLYTLNVLQWLFVITTLPVIIQRFYTSKTTMTQFAGIWLFVKMS